MRERIENFINEVNGLDLTFAWKDISDTESKLFVTLNGEADNSITITHYFKDESTPYHVDYSFKLVEITFLAWQTKPIPLRKNDLTASELVNVGVYFSNRYERENKLSIIERKCLEKEESLQ